MKKRVISAVLAIICVSSIVMPAASAVEESPMQPYYIGISQVNISLDISGTSLGADLAKCLGLVMLYDGYSADVTLSLQRSSNKTDWSTIKSWDASGEEEVSIYKEYFVVNGYYYRLNVLAYVYYPSGGIAEIVSKYSPIQP